ncbi:MAG: 2,5-diamino-6-(ribosylamino)-4(3H)-pyrimidinone 5'-phosphate reductase, partial [Methanomassiliicoccales archaeon]|nr:2,5-diamino-6-(ribosylamino)-4(3H)-pyrimidinone 5'-phosphate reductase [Methanomassiliicoccales archaeon]
MRPFVIVNCAMTADGKIAGRSRRQLRISSGEDLERVQSLRASSDAILVGVGTILADDPHLTAKGAPAGKTPLRIVLDSNGRTPDEAKVLDGTAPTLIATADGSSKTWSGAEVLRCGSGRVDLGILLAELHRRGVRTLLVEGGGEVVWSFFSGGFVDRYCVFVGNILVGGSTSPTPVDGEGFPDDETVVLKIVEVRRLGSGVLLCYEVV